MLSFDSPSGLWFPSRKIPDLYSLSQLQGPLKFWGSFVVCALLWAPLGHPEVWGLCEAFLGPQSETSPADISYFYIWVYLFSDPCLTLLTLLQSGWLMSVRFQLGLVLVKYLWTTGGSEAERGQGFCPPFPALLLSAAFLLWSTPFGQDCCGSSFPHDLGLWAVRNTMSFHCLSSIGVVLVSCYC